MSRSIRYGDRALVTLLILLAGACADGPVGPESPRTDPSLDKLPELIVSEPTAPLGALVSLPPGKLTDVVKVQLRNVTSAVDVRRSVLVSDGGFDPSSVDAVAGDVLGLELVHGDGAVTEVRAPVPLKRPPVVVRMSPPRGRTDVALSVRPVVVFSEPMDPASLPVGMRLVTRGTLVNAEVRLIEPWIAELVPAAPLEPGTDYRVEVSRDARDLGGTAVESPAEASFTTEAAPFTPALAFVRRPQPTAEGGGGLPSIYLAPSDGSRVRRLTHGDVPAWSPDGRRIAFVRGAQLRLIEADGSGERLLASGEAAGWSPGEPSWSPDGTKLVFTAGYVDAGDILVVDVAHPGAPIKLFGNGHPNSEYAPVPAWPRWSPDGRSIAFVSMPLDWVAPKGLTVMDADGSHIREVFLSWPPCQGIDSCEFLPGPIVEQHAWSPDGSRIVAPFHLYYPPTLSREGLNAIALVSFDPTGNNLRVDFTEPREDLYSYVEHPTWSPDGRSLAFAKFVLDVACTPPGCPMRIWTVNLDSGVARQLIPSVPGQPYWDSKPSWSPTAE